MKPRTKSREGSNPNMFRLLQKALLFWGLLTLSCHSCSGQALHEIEDLNLAYSTLRLLDEAEQMPSNVQQGHGEQRHRDLGFFVNTGRPRRSRGNNLYRERSGKGKGGRGRGMMGDRSSYSMARYFYSSPDEYRIVQAQPVQPTRGSTGGSTLPNIDRDRDPLVEGMWKRKRVDMIRTRAGPSPKETPSPTTSPTQAPTNATEIPSTNSSETTPPMDFNLTVPSPGGENTTDAIPLGVEGQEAEGGDGGNAPTTAPGGDGGDNTDADAAAPTLMPTVAAGADATAVPTVATAVRSAFDVLPADVECTSGPEDFAFGLDIKINFPNQKFKACSARQFNALSNMMEITLNMGFPGLVPNWPGDVVFEEIKFDVDQFALHVNPYTDNVSKRRLRSESNQHKYIVAEDGRQLFQPDTTCPERTTICQDTTDVCLFACGIASVSKCGDLSQWSRVETALSKAISSLALDCLGAPDPPVVELKLLSV